jgi:hypothetical protein
MNKLLNALAAAALLLTPVTLLAAPPYSGTIFIDGDIITSADPTTFTGLTANGQGNRLMFDRRTNSFNNVNAYLFNATFSDGLTSEVQVNPEFGGAAAQVEALKYSTVLGRLPKVLRTDMAAVWIHQGVEAFGGGNNSVLIHTGQSANYEASGILEETLVHELSHTSLDADHAATPGWLAAQAADPEFISTYARDNPTREDIAESFLPWLALRHRSGRIDAATASTFSSTIPNRLAYFDAQGFNVAPVPEPTGLTLLAAAALALGGRRRRRAN